MDPKIGSSRSHLLAFFFVCQAKGQLISKCPYEKSVSSKIPTEIFLDFCPENFVAFWASSSLPYL
jgi:hypothetical protein